MEKKNDVADDSSKSQTGSSETLPAKKEMGLRLLSPFNLPVEQDRLVSPSPFLPGSSPSDPGKPWTPTLCHVADALRLHGIVDPSHLRMALISFVVGNSAALGYPLALEIIDDEQAGAAKMLDMVSKLTPESNQIRLSNFSLESLSLEKDRLQGGVFLVYDGENFKNPSNLNQLLERQELSTKEPVKTKFGPLLQEIEVKGPVSCIVVNKNPKKLVLSHPSFLRIQMNPGNTIQILPNLDEKGKENLDLIAASVKSSMERYQPALVEIPFTDQIVKALEKSKFSHVSERLNAFLEMIKIITLINNPPPTHMKELWARAIRFDTRNIISGRVSDVKSSKVDYYTFYTLMKDYGNDENTLSERQLRVFRAIRDFNVGVVKGATFPEGSSDVEILVTISANEAAWPSPEKILEKLAKDGGEAISYTTLRREIGELEQKKIIDRRKDPKAKNKFIYAVNSLSVGQNLNLPHPSEIEDPVFNKKSVSVINPVTGQVETI